MIRYILTNRWILGCVALLIYFSTVCVVKSKDDTATYKFSKAEFYKTLSGQAFYSEDTVLNIAYSPDNKYLIVAGPIGLLRYETQTYQKPFLFTRDKNIGSVTFSPDGKILASVNGHNIRLWDTVTGKHKQTITGHKNDVEGVVFSPNGKTLASWSRNGWGFASTIHLWDAKTGKRKQTITDCERYRNIPSRLWDGILGILGMKLTACRAALHVFDLTFSPDGKILAISGGHYIYLCNNKSGIYKRALKADTTIFCIAFSPDGKTLAGGGSDGTIHLWDAKTGEQQQNLTGHKDTVFSLTFSPDGRMLVSGSRNGTIHLWDAKTGEQKQNLTGHTNVVNSVVFNPDGKMIASAGWDGKVLLWNFNVDN